MMKYTLRQMFHYHFAFLIRQHGRLRLWWLENVRHVKPRKTNEEKAH